MIKKLHFTTLLLLLSFSVFSQKGTTYGLCGYKTYDDFFEGKCHYMCDYNQSKDDVIFKGIDKTTGEKFKFHMKKDSAMVGYKSLQMPLNPYSKYIVSTEESYYRLFLCGTKKLFVALPSLSGLFIGKFKENGEVIKGTLNGYADESVKVIYVKDLDFKNETSDIEKAISDNKLVYEKYLAEKEATDKKVWRDSKLSIAVKYVKMYNEN